VFTRVLPRANAAQHLNRTTGVLRLCAQCKLPFARETTSCPHCGAVEQTDEDTLSGTFGHESQHSWSVQLLLDATDKALGLGRVPDADRMLRRATGLFEDRITEGGDLEPAQVARAAMVAIRIAEAAKDPSWGGWITRFYARAKFALPAHLSDRLAQLAAEHPELSRVPERAEVLDEQERDTEDDAEAVRLGERGV
jgi:hypothetical protein